MCSSRLIQKKQVLYPIWKLDVTVNILVLTSNTHVDVFCCDSMYFMVACLLLHAASSITGSDLTSILNVGYVR